MLKNNTHVRLALLCAVFVACIPAGLHAETQLSIDGQIRARSEIDGRSFQAEAATGQYTDLRTRLSLEALVDDNVTGLIQFQDSRRLGGLTREGEPASGLLNDGGNVDLHQAYVRVERLWSNGPFVQAGRFEVNLGNQRVFGAVGWSNTGRAWEGLQVGQDLSSIKATAFWLKRLEVNDPGYNQDFDVIGVNAEIPSAHTEVFAFLEHDASPVDGAEDPDANRLDRVDLGVYTRQTTGPVDITVNGVLQTGTAYVGMDEMDLSGILFTGELGYQFEGDKQVRLAAGVDFASGDDDPADDTINTYDNLYFTGHKFRGYMDYFLASNPEGLVDWMARASARMCPGWTLKADIHHFQTAVDYVDFEGAETKSVGTEVDLTVSTTRVPGVTLDGGAALFLPSDSFAASTDNESGLWFFGQMTVAFGGK